MVSPGHRTLSVSDILNYIDEIDILNFYVGVDYVPQVILSPLRPDKNPSFNLDYNDFGSIRFYDFGTAESGGVFDLIMRIYKISFSMALEMIYDDLIDGKGLNPVVRIKFDRSSHTKSRIDNLQVKTRPLQKHDIDFWNSFGINEQWLRFGDVYPISHMFITKDGNEMIIPCDRYAYVYVEFKGGSPTFKIYQPFSDRYKWIGMHGKSVWDLWSKIPESGSVLILTSSRKDALCIWANLGIPSVCLQAESVDPKEHVVVQLANRFKKIYVLYDNDFKSERNTGRINGMKLAESFGFEQIEIPSIYNSKDPSDLYKNYGYKTFKEIMKKLINE